MYAFLGVARGFERDRSGYRGDLWWWKEAWLEVVKTWYSIQMMCYEIVHWNLHIYDVLTSVISISSIQIYIVIVWPLLATVAPNFSKPPCSLQSRLGFLNYCSLIVFGNKVALGPYIIFVHILSISVSMLQFL